MDILSIIITLVSLVAGVLQIILFFKVWGMCDDIKALRQQHCSASQSSTSGLGGGLLFLLVGAIWIIFIVFLVIMYV